MAHKLTKKGPHSVTIAAPKELKARDLDSTIRAFAKKAHRVIQKARRKMTPQERARADENANAILEHASAASKSTRRRA
jgi:hypothetical protein